MRTPKNAESAPVAGPAAIGQIIGNKNHQIFNSRVCGIEGGDITSSLSSCDINRILRGVVDVDSALFFSWRAGLVSTGELRKTINDALATKSSVTFVGHFRHHWVALRFSATLSLSAVALNDTLHHPSPKKLSIEVWDSAPSPIVKRDIVRLCSSFRWPFPVFHNAPHQIRGTEECGLFAIAATLLLLEDPSITLPSGTFSLQSLRAILSSSNADSAILAQILATVKDLYGLVGRSNVSSDHSDPRPDEPRSLPLAIPLGGTRALLRSYAG